MDIEQLKLIISSLEGATEKAAWVAGAWLVVGLLKTVIPGVLFTVFGIFVVNKGIDLIHSCNDVSNFVKEIMNKHGIDHGTFIFTHDIEKLRKKLEL